MATSTKRAATPVAKTAQPAPGTGTKPATSPRAKPAAKPAPRTATTPAPAARPAAKRAARPAVKPAHRPAKPASRAVAPVEVAAPAAAVAPAPASPPPAPGPVPLPRDAEHAYIDGLIRRIVATCPRRQPTSDDERRALEIMRDEFAALGLDVRTQPFLFNDNLYANMLLHAGVATAGTAVSGVAPLLGLAMHLGAALSYWGESTRRGYFLRRVFPFKPSFNVLATLPAEGVREPALRVVLMGHADAAFTGWTFEPALTRFTVPKGEGPLTLKERSVEMMVASQFVLAGCDAARLVLGPLAWPLRPLEWLLTVPSMISLVLNAQTVIRNEIVPGANDNLTGTAVLPVLARRLAARKPADVEYVFVVTGCEEASLGGGDALGKAMAGLWDRDRTVFVGLDGLGNGDLRFLEVEGEVRRTRIPAWLADTARGVTASDPRFAEVTGFEVPIGGSDVAALLAQGWDGICLACVDPTTGAPRHYHMPTDDPDHLEMDKVMFSVDYTERLVDAIVSRRRGA